MLHDLKLIDLIARLTASLAYFLVLAQRLRNGDFLAAPIFTLYLAAMCLREACGFQRVSYALLLEPSVLALRFFAVIEAVRLCFTTRELEGRKWLRLTMLAVACGGIWALYRLGYGLGSSLQEIYASVRQYFHVSLAFACLIGAYMLNDIAREWKPRAHYLTFTAHLCLIAIIGFCFTPGWAQGTRWRELHIWYETGSCVCLAAWWRLAGTVERFNFRACDRWPLSAE